MLKILQILLTYTIFHYSKNTIIFTQDVIYKIEKEDIKVFSIYEILIDLRHINYYDNKFRYGVEWTIKLNYKTSKTEYDFFLFKHNFPEPTGFYSTSTIPFQFAFEPLENGTLTLFIERENDKFKDQILSFTDCVNINVKTPYRADKENMIFTTAIMANSKIKMPNNIFYLNKNDKIIFPEFIISSYADFDTIQQMKKENVNLEKIFKEEIFKNKEIIYHPISYLPYFMNCDKIGNYIFVSDLFENEEDCTLFSKEEIIPISNFDFGTPPVADKCLRKFKCFFDMDITKINPVETDYWFLANIKSVLFKFYTYPVDLETFETKLKGYLINEENLVNVNVITKKQNKKIPTIVNLSIGYYQRGKSNKEIINSNISFSGYLDPKNVEYYTLTIDVRALTHTELTISFALDWYLYLLVFIGVGVVSVLTIFIWFLYHLIFKIHKDAKFYCWPYCSLALLPALEGVGVAIFIQIVYLILIGFLYLHRFMKFTFSPFNCDSNDKECMSRTIWDYFTTEIPNNDLNGLRNCRFGIILVHFGLYLTFKSTSLLKTKKQNDFIENKSENFDRNIWEANLWQKGTFYWIWSIYLIFELYRIHFSFSNLFGQNVWYFLSTYKVMGIISEIIINYFLNDDLQLLVFSTMLGLIENLTTAGANDLIDFIKGFIIGLAILMFERIYANYIIDYIVMIISKSVKKMIEFAKSIVKKEEEDYEQLRNDNQNENILNDEDKDKEEIENLSIDSSASDILISDSEYQEKVVYGFIDKLKKQNKRKNKIKNLKSIIKSKKNFGKKKTYHDYNSQNSQKQSSVSLKIKKNENKEDSKKKEKKYENIFDFSKEMDKYAMYCNQTVGLLFLPFSFWIIWSFYKEINIAPSWGIKEKDFLYYFLFALVVIPFQVVMDILFYNIEHYYNGLNFRLAMIHWKKIFLARNNDWIGFDKNNDEFEDTKRELYKQCFSPQLYFVITLGTSGILITLFGLMAIINSSFNPFSDPYLFMVIISNHLVIKSGEFLILKLRIYLKFWVIKKRKNSISLMLLNKRLNFFKRDNKNMLVQKDHLEIDNITKINLPIQEKNKNFFLLETISKEFDNESYQDKFLKINKNILKSKFKKIFSPRTVVNKKLKINKIFKKIFGELNFKKNQTKKIKKLTKIELSNSEKDDIKMKLNKKFEKILLYWLKRAQKIKLIKSQVARLLEKFTSIKCDYCHLNWGLRCEPINNIEETFDEFCKTEFFCDGCYTLFDWQEYFEKFTRFRTICYYCSQRVYLQN